MDFYLTTNVGTYTGSRFVLEYPRHLILAHLWDCIGYATRTAELKDRGATIMLDNGTHEGLLVDDARYAAIIDQAQPSIVVLPDLISVLSSGRSVYFALAYKRVLRKRTLVFSVQGISAEDVIQEYIWAMDHLDPQRYILGLGQSYLQFLAPRTGPDNEQEDHEPAREKLLGQLMSHPKFDNFRWHILGARWTPTRLYGALPLAMANIVGINSVKPCICALAGRCYPHRPEQFTFSHASMTIADTWALETNVKAISKDYAVGETGHDQDS